MGVKKSHSLPLASLPHVRHFIKKCWLLILIAGMSGRKSTSILQTRKLKVLSMSWISQGYQSKQWQNWVNPMDAPPTDMLSLPLYQLTAGSPWAWGKCDLLTCGARSLSSFCKGRICHSPEAGPI